MSALSGFDSSARTSPEDERKDAEAGMPERLIAPAPVVTSACTLSGNFTIRSMPTAGSTGVRTTEITEQLASVIDDNW